MAFDPYGPRTARSMFVPRWSSIFLALTFFFLFSSGYLYGQADAIQGRHVLSPLLRQLGIDPSLVGIYAVAPAGADLNDTDRQHLQAFWETWNYVNEEFFPRDHVNHEQMIYAAIRGMLSTLGDPNSVFLSPSQREISDADLRGSFDGVGISVESSDGAIRVISPVDGSPAHEAGIISGDVVTHVDDTDVRALNINDVVPLIRGQRGTTVRLTIERQGLPAPLEFVLTRAEIRLQNIRARMLDQQIGYIRISSFSRNAPQELSDRINDLLVQRPSGLVLDLRSNPGGFVNSAIDITSQFLDDGVVLYQRGAGGDDQEYRTKGAGRMTSQPIAVLVNRGTASASEITAAALRDSGRAVLVGEKTFGKGTVQTVRQLSDRSGLRLTSAQWLTPEKTPIQGQGLQPDIAVDPAAAGGDNDAAIAEAVRYLSTELAQQSVAGASP
ncbi:MAG TPA: S41 family peptidase [Chloroflexota bacterium]|jgi:carboxyl-terminal processing protease|nr:S41 family peptidase [Chloroflexota bacterium]